MSSDQNKFVDGVEDEELYDAKILQELNWDDSKHLFQPPITPTCPGDGIVIRPLRKSDYEKGFPEVLSQLTKVGNVSHQQFLNTFHLMKSCKDSYFVTVIEDSSRNRVIGTATMCVEQKFVHSCALRGRIEDVVIDDAYRGQQLGKLIIEVAKQLGKHIGCYKVSLDCRDKMTKFYMQLGFVQEEGNSNIMTIRYRD